MYSSMGGGVRSRVAASVLLALLLTACRSSQRKTIAVVPKATSHLFWVSVQAGALAAGQDLKVEVLWNGPPSETDYARQVQIQHFNRPNKPRAKPACLVALNNHSVKFYNLSGPILL